MRFLTLTAAALALTTAAASATDRSYEYHGGYSQYGNYDIDRRQARQGERIYEGRRNGSLTWWEAMKLRREQRAIADMEARAKADGRLTRYEREKIDQAQDAASRHIYQERHDGQTRWWRRYW